MVTAPQSRSKQFSLKWLFSVLAIVGVLAAILGFILRPRPDRIPEAQLYTVVEGVEDGMEYEEVCKSLGLGADATWFNDETSGFAVWRFEVSDVNYSDSRASFFVKFEAGAVVESTLLYPLEAAGGGMTF